MMKRPALLLSLALAAAPLRRRPKPAVTIPPPAAEAPAQGAGLETAVLAGGCFWGIQAVFQHVKGVKNAVSGYAGGAQKDADYETVSSGRTGHAEAVQVTYDPQQISYGKILQIFSRSRTTRRSSTARAPTPARNIARRFSRRTRRSRKSPRPTSRSSMRRKSSSARS